MTKTIKKGTDITISTSFLTVLGIVFVGLKLTGVIDWSWWWVLAPFWIPVALAVVILLVVLLAFSVYIVAKRLGKD